jgi:SET domain-containing protein
MNQRALNRQKNKHRTLNRRALKEIQRGTAVIEPHGDETQSSSRAKDREIQRGTAVIEPHGVETQ